MLKLGKRKKLLIFLFSSWYNKETKTEDGELWEREAKHKKKADKAYYEKVKGQKKLFGVMLSVEEIDHIREVLDAHGIGNAELIRRAVARLERGEEL